MSTHPTINLDAPPKTAPLAKAKRHLTLLSTSSVKTYRACPRLYLYQYVHGYRSLTISEALKFGTLWHFAMELYWRGRKAGLWGVPLLEQVIESLRELSAEKEDTDPFDLVKVEELLVGYDTRWSDDENELEILAVEAEFRIPIINPKTGAASKTFELGGKLDVIVRLRKTGEIWVIEHKTSSEDVTPGSMYWRKLALDPQVSNYFAGGRGLGFGNVVGCIYDVICKTKLRPFKETPDEQKKYTKDGRLYAAQHDHDETPEEYRLRVRAEIVADPQGTFGRGPVVRLEEQELDAAHDLWAATHDIREATNDARWPKNPDACNRYHHLCEFFGVCTSTASLDDDTQFTRAEWVHPELAKETA